MTSVMDLAVLLKAMKPVLDDTDYVFTTQKVFKLTNEVVGLKPIATFLEEEGMTLVLTKLDAEKHQLAFDTIFQKITLEVYSSLEAVGLTAAISAALTAHNISANVIAGYYHDHIFVQKDKAELALETLAALSEC